ncbi:hypothetical protein VP01_376g4 [Puccinia sorghi]|uniref:Uncharacterized protein n=1 Tax=Puccinia sorghi TaxID=27349 RepID=A0A0L6UTP8_9BASI|nr:hypothetical protein VP01_376g4 [Puccinia sorghi]
MYLGIKLPFQLIMGPCLSIRAPINSIWSKRCGGPSHDFAEQRTPRLTRFLLYRHPSPYPLHIPSSITSTVHSTGSQVSHIAFLSGLCMLALNARYLLLTQQPQLRPPSLARASEENPCQHPTAQPPLSMPQPTLLAQKPTDLLHNLHSLCLSRPLGLFSHLTGPSVLLPPDHPSNPACIDVQQVINEVLQSKHEDSVDEGWSMI